MLRQAAKKPSGTVAGLHLEPPLVAHCGHTRPLRHRRRSGYNCSRQASPLTSVWVSGHALSSNLRKPNTGATHWSTVESTTGALLHSGGLQWDLIWQSTVQQQSPQPDYSEAKLFSKVAGSTVEPTAESTVTGHCRSYPAMKSTAESIVELAFEPTAEPTTPQSFPKDHTQHCGALGHWVEH